MDLHIKGKCALLLSIKTSSQMIKLGSVFKNYDTELKHMVHVDKTCSRFTTCGTLSEWWWVRHVLVYIVQSKLN